MMLNSRKISWRHAAMHVFTALAVLSLLSPARSKPLSNSDRDEDRMSPGYTNPEEMQEGDDEMIEGDGAEQKDGLSRVKRKALKNEATRWPNAIVPYEITDSSENDSDAILQAMAHWEEKTCLRFVEWQPSVTLAELGHDHRISFIHGSGCWSFIGMISTESQNISIGSGCAFLGTVAHEIGHAIGFYHEQRRPDRDDSIIVYNDNIKTTSQNSYAKTDTNTVMTDVPYDVKSIMHYGAYSSSNAIDSSKPVITTINPLDMRWIGQRDGLSFLDAKTANLIYNCNTGCPSLNCANEGYVGPNCTCVCPEEYTGSLCEESNTDYIPPCESVLTSTSGSIQSPDFGNGNYPTSTICMYHIKPTSNLQDLRITLNFDAFSVEPDESCSFDYVRVFSDSLTYGGQTFCGTTIPEPITSVGSEMVVLFRSDSSVTAPGFRAKYSIFSATTTTSSSTTQLSSTSAASSEAITLATTSAIVIIEASTPAATPTAAVTTAVSTPVTTATEITTTATTQTPTTSAITSTLSVEGICSCICG